METLCLDAAQTLVETPSSQHELVAAAGSVSEHYFALAQRQLKTSNARLAPGARQQVEKEWSKLESPQVEAWRLSTVRDEADIVAEAQRAGQTVHF